MRFPQVEPFGGEVLVLCLVWCGLMTACTWRIRRRQRPWVWIVVGGYNVALLALYIFGLACDVGLGFAFLPVVILTAPWSVVLTTPVMSLLGRAPWLWRALDAFDGGLVVLVGFFGGLNSTILYVFVRWAFYREPSAENTQPLLGPSA